jgi:flagellar biosynthesis activator protein FlaF
MQSASYLRVVSDSPSAERRRERDAILRTIDMMMLAETAGRQSVDAAKAMLAVQRLWSIFIEDLSQPENALPPKLRADMISIGLWMFREIENIRSGEEKSFQALIEVSASIADGLA